MLAEDRPAVERATTTKLVLFARRNDLKRISHETWLEVAPVATAACESRERERRKNDGGKKPPPPPVLYFVLCVHHPA